MADHPKPNDQPPPDSPPPGSDGGGKGPLPPPSVKLNRGLMSWVMILGLLIMLFFLLNGNRGRGIKIATWEEFKSGLMSANIPHRKVLIKDDRMVWEPEDPEQTWPGATAQGKPAWVRIDGANRDWFLTDLQTLNKEENLGAGQVQIIADTGTSVWVNLLITLAPFILVILLIWFFIARSMRSAICCESISVRMRS